MVGAKYRISESRTGMKSEDDVFLWSDQEEKDAWTDLSLAVYLVAATIYHHLSINTIHGQSSFRILSIPCIERQKSHKLVSPF